MMWKEKHFTLLELLIVIAIIAILASLLLPALSKAKERTKTILCQGNLKQSGIAFMMYIQDNAEQFPFYTISYSADFIHGDYIKNSNVFLCPSKKEYNATYDGFWQKDAMKASILDAKYNYAHYGYTWRTLGSSYDIDGTDKPSKLQKIRNPGNTILLADTIYKPNTSVGCSRLYGYDYAGATGILQARHLKGLNVLWVDGHITYQKVSNLLLPYETDPFRNGNINGNSENNWDRE